MPQKLTPVQVIATSLQTERLPGTHDHPFVNLDGAVLRGFADDAIRMLGAYGYAVVPKVSADQINLILQEVTGNSNPHLAVKIAEAIESGIYGKQPHSRDSCI